MPPTKRNENKCGDGSGSGSSLLDLATRDNDDDGGGGWMTTKKRGRDDDAIERDKNKALNERRRNRNGKKKKAPSKKKNKGKGKKKKKPAQPKKKKKKRSSIDDDLDWDDDDEEEISEYSDSDSDEESMDDFIVGSDEDEEESDLNLGSSENEHEDESSSSSDEALLSSFLPKAKKRTSKSVPLPQLRQNQRKQKQQRSRSASNNSSATTNKRQQRRTTNTATATTTNTKSRFFAASSSTGNNGKKKAEPEQPKSKKTNNNKKKDDDIVELGDSSSSDDVYEDTKKPAAAAATTASRKPPPPRKEAEGTAPVVDLLKSDEDEDDDDDLFPTKFGNDYDDRKKSPAFARRGGKNNQKNRSVLLDDESDDDDSDAIPNKKKTKKSTFESAFAVDGEDADDEDLALAMAIEESKKTASQQQQQQQDVAVDDLLLDSPDPASSSSGGRLKKKKKGTKKNNKKNKSKKSSSSSNLDSLQSLVEGRSAARRKKGSSSSLPDDDDDEEEDVMDLVDSSDDNDDDDDDQDDYVDEDARTAGSVLETANNLSAQVLRVMTQWSNTTNATTTDTNNNTTATTSSSSGTTTGSSSSLKSDNDKDDEGSSGGIGAADATTKSANGTGSVVPMGMIVDGALSLAAIEQQQQQDNMKNPEASEWISQESIQKLCPTLTLASYQLVAVNWLALLHNMKCKVVGSSNGGNNKEKETNVNGVLADEMGLGKTVQTIAFLSWLAYKKRGKVPGSTAGGPSNQGDPIVLGDSDDEDAEKQQHKQNASSNSGSGSTGHRPHLVVAPASVLSNWEREFETFAPHLNVVKYHGSQLERNELQRELQIHLPKNEQSRGEQEPLDVILCSVTYFEKENPDDRSFLKKLNYDYLIVDEAHALKNAKGKRYRNLDRFNTQHRLLLTGTPVQNNAKELMCLLCFLMPLFSRSRSGAYYDDEDESKNDGGESMLQHFVSLEGQNGPGEAAAYRKLKQLFAPFVLRRKKVDVLGQLIPPKQRKVEFVQLDESGRALYDEILSDHVKAKKNGSSTREEHLFTQLRKAAHHPLLIRARHKSPEEKEHLARCFHQYGAFRGEGCTREKVMQELDKYNDFDIHLTALELLQENPHRRKDLERYILNEQDLYASAKFARLRTLLPELVNDGHRVLIFSVWTSCLDLLACLLEQLDMNFLRMEGSTPVNERQGLIDQFNGNTSIPVFLLSTKACGLGINLTSADTCVMHDLDFNPFNDLQAEDRCHRIGQKRPVTVIKMVTKDSVDEDIYAMQERKSKMNAAIMENNHTTTAGGSSSTTSSGNNDDNDKEWNAAKEKRAVLTNAVARFLGSPAAAGGGSSSKQGPLATSTAGTTAAVASAPPACVAAAATTTTTTATKKLATVDTDYEAATTGSEKENHNACGTTTTTTTTTTVEMISTDDL